MTSSKRPSKPRLDGQDSTSSAPLHGYRVLVVDDDPVFRESVTWLLALAGAEVTFAENGKVAYDLIQSQLSADGTFDAITMDMNMPVLDGYSATRKLRAVGYRGPIVAVTGNPGYDERKKCLDAGCDEFLMKLDFPQQLISFIARCVSTDSSG